MFLNGLGNSLASQDLQSANHFACSNALIALYSVFPADCRAVGSGSEALSHPLRLKAENIT